MAMYNLYAGLGGGFGGAHYMDTCEFETQDEAEKAAYLLAIEEYQSYEGHYGLMSWDDIKTEYREENGLCEGELTPEDESIIDEMYDEEMYGWLCYHVILQENDIYED